MKEFSYQLNPVLMEGTVTTVTPDQVSLNLRGRLGVVQSVPSLFLQVPQVGKKFRFYFSYMQIVQSPLDYDYAPLTGSLEFIPVLAGGTLSVVNDTAIKADCIHGLVTIAVPRRWVFTDVALEAGQYTEFYFSPFQAVEKS